MLTRALAFTVALGSVLCIVTLLAGDAQAVKQFQQAVDLLEGKGEPARAAELFEAVGRSSDRSLAARALFYLAEAQRRLGKTDAQAATYHRIVTAFPTDTDVVAKARERLAELEGPPTPSEGMLPVVSGDDADPSAYITPDGHFLSRTDPRNGDVLVRDMRTNRTKRLMVKSDTLDASPDHAERPMISPDGSRVVYMWVSRAEQNSSRYLLRIVRTEAGSQPRDLVSKTEYTYFEPIGWSAAGDAVFVTAWKRDDTSEFLQVSLSDRAVKVLDSHQWRLGASRPRVSPNGKYIAYSAVPPGSATPTAQERQTALTQGPLHLYVVPTDASSPPVEIVRGSINESPVWTPDGGRIVFVSNRSAGFGLWSVAVEKGRAAGDASYVQANITGRIRPIGMTSFGALYYVPDVPGGVRAVDVFLADLDPENGRIKGEATRLFDTEVDRSQAPSWSPDGERVAFKRLLATGGVPPQQERLEVVIYSPSTRAVVDRFSRAGIDAGPTLWYRDGRYLLVRGNNGGLQRLDSRTRQFLPIESVAHSRLPPECGSHVLSQGDGILYLSVLDQIPDTVPPEARSSYRRTRRVVAFDVTTGDQKDVLSPATLRMLSVLAVSPDGQWLALSMQRDAWKTPRLVLLRVGDGALREQSSSLVPRSASWTRAGLLVAHDGPERTEIVRVSTSDGTFTQTGLQLARGGQFFDVSPNGTHVIFSDRSRNGEDRLWAYYNLVSLVKAGR